MDALPWKPEILDPSVARDVGRLADLRCAGRVLREHDTLDLQLSDLADTRHPGRALTPDERACAIEAIRGGQSPSAYGRYVFFGWTGELVRLLPPAEFAELRLDRNRNKVTREEIARLRQKTVGVVGLSVGNAVALTLALEGACGALVLADFDTLSTSNMNRVRASVTEIGLPKAVIAARQIARIDPYLRVELLSEGITAENADAFVSGVDVCVDECDSVAMKALLRQRCRERGVPVVMETSDRGLLDVERFDLERGRPLLHGLLPEWPVERFQALSADERVGMVARIVGERCVSVRAAASLLELKGTLSTWPQLASDVALGGATVTAAVRRILLGQPMSSGRRYVDLEKLLTSEPEPQPQPERQPQPQSRAEPRPAIPFEALLSAAVRAPSGGNCQPWRFHVDGSTVWVVHDAPRSRTLLDRTGEAAMVALGAAVENLCIAATHHELEPRVTAFPRPDRPDVVARVDLSSGWPKPDPLLDAVFQRVTDRRRPARTALPDATKAALLAAIGSDATLRLREGPLELDLIGEILAEVDRVRFLHPVLHDEMMKELRWTAAAADATRDGMGLDEIEAGDLDKAVMAELSRPDVAAFLRSQNGGSKLGDPARAWIRSASAVGLISALDGSHPAAFAAGRAAQRVWLTATAQGIGLQPVGVVSYMIRHLGTEAEAGYLPRERDALRRADAAIGELFGERASEKRLLLFRLVQAGPPVVRSRRRDLAEVVSLGAP
jgi:molybdopterin/thiamine biosynthesis adenylyltransferase/nitroreductase